MSPYKITEPTVISFSGGRTSAYMLHKVIELGGGNCQATHLFVLQTREKKMKQLSILCETLKTNGMCLLFGLNTQEMKLNLMLLHMKQQVAKVNHLQLLLNPVVSCQTL
jgi:hypothetical protein